jgi:hypothetical protein
MVDNPSVTVLVMVEAGSSNMPVNPFRKFAVANKAFVEKKLGTKML